MTPQTIIRSTVVALLAATTLSLTACGGSDDTTTTAPAQTTATTTATAADDDGGCGGDVVDAVKKAVTSPAVQKIQVIGGCTMVSIETNLGPDAKADGGKICDAASKVAYTGSVSSVSVDGADHHELAAGEKGQPCI